jgi:Flp pilus assembly protein TadD
LGIAGLRLRSKLGERLATIQKFDVPLAQATTSSLEAWQAYAMGAECSRKGDYFGAIEAFKHATELDPNFASAYSELGAMYGNQGRGQLSREAHRRSYDLIDRVSEREKFHIATHYHRLSGDVDKGMAVAKLWCQAYPRDAGACNVLGILYGNIGQAEKAVEAYRNAIRLEPDGVIPYINLSDTLSEMGKDEEAYEIAKKALALSSESVAIHNRLLGFAALMNDQSQVRAHLAWIRSKPNSYHATVREAEFAAFSGKMKEANALYLQASKEAQQQQFTEASTSLLRTAAYVNARCGNCSVVRGLLLRIPNCSAAAPPELLMPWCCVGVWRRLRSQNQVILSRQLPIGSRIQFAWQRSKFKSETTGMQLT